MKTKLSLAILIILLCSGSAFATTYYFFGTVTTCTGTCDGFASLSLGTEISGQWEISTSASGSWAFGDISGFDASVLSLSAPMETYNGANSTTANPLPLTAAIAPLVASGGGNATGGTTDAGNELNSGILLHKFIVPPFNSNGAWVIFEIGSGGQTTAHLCIFYETAGCLPGATLVAEIEGIFSTDIAVPIETTSWSSVKGLYR